MTTDKGPSTVQMLKWMAINVAMQQAMAVASVGILATAVPLRLARKLLDLRREQED